MSMELLQGHMYTCGRCRFSVLVDAYDPLSAVRIVHGQDGRHSVIVPESMVWAAPGDPPISESVELLRRSGVDVVIEPGAPRRSRWRKFIGNLTKRRTA